MFRGVTKFKGLVIDVDSFEDEIEVWGKFVEEKNCYFLTMIEDTEQKCKTLFGPDKVLKYSKYIRSLLPNPEIHFNILKAIDLLSSEIVYVSANYTFIENALCFLSGTIYIKEEILTYREMSNCADCVCQSVEDMFQNMKRGILGFAGERLLFPSRIGKYGCVVPVLFEFDVNITLFVLGRYFGYSHYMNQLHPYSSGIYWNKYENGKAYGVLNKRFGSLLSSVIEVLNKGYNLDCVCNVPARPGKENRFSEIIENVSMENNLHDISGNFVCIREYESQKGLSNFERAKNIHGVFQYNGSLKRKRVVLIDDVMTTGATVKECVKELKKCGVSEVLIIVLAVNQYGGNYWSAELPLSLIHI